MIRTEFGRFTRQVSGYSLEHLLPENGADLAKFLVGTEGTLGLVAGATVRLVRSSSTAPSRRSSCWIARDSGGCAIPSRCAARPKCSSSATTKNFLMLSREGSLAASLRESWFRS